MEERPPPPPPPPQSNSKPHLPGIAPGTYVVQVPKDQIYRVPPPENSRIAELHRSSPKRETKCKGCCCLLLVIVVVIIIIVTTIVGGVLGGLFSIVLSPKSPRFTVQRFRLNKPQYEVVLEAHNPNSKVGITYKQGGRVSLSLKRQQIATGDYPSFYQPQHNSTAFALALRGSGPEARLPKEVHVKLSLAIGMQARMKMGLLRSGTMTYQVTCQFTVDTLAKDTTLVSQQCDTKRH